MRPGGRSPAKHVQYMLVHRYGKRDLYLLQTYFLNDMVHGMAEVIRNDNPLLSRELAGMTCYGRSSRSTRTGHEHPVDSTPRRPLSPTLHQPEHLLLSDPSEHAKLKITDLKFATDDGKGQFPFHEQTRSAECETRESSRTVPFMESSRVIRVIRVILFVARGGQGVRFCQRRWRVAGRVGRMGRVGGDILIRKCENDSQFVT